jgi:hypothetical protein
VYVKVQRCTCVCQDKNAAQIKNEPKVLADGSVRAGRDRLFNSLSFSIHYKGWETVRAYRMHSHACGRVSKMKGRDNCSSYAFGRERMLVDRQSS